MRWSLFALSLASCFNPTYPEIGCGPGDWCPEGQSCGSDGLCHHPPDAAPPPDGGRADAAAGPDGRVGPDAAVTDAAIDAVLDTTPPTATHSPTTPVLDDNKAVVVTFSESMNTTTLTLGGTLTDYDRTATWSTTTFTDDTLTLSPATTDGFWPAADPTRTLIVDGTDLAGNPLATYTITYDAPPLESFVGGGGGAAAGGVTGFDGLCQSVAESQGLHGTWVAWISSSTSDAYCRVHGLTGRRAVYCGQSTLPSWAGPWVRVDGVPFLEIAAGIPHPLTAPVILVNGGYFGGSGVGNPLWTSTDVSGTFNGATDCTDWTDNAAPGTLTTGWTDMVGNWTNGGTGVCSDIKWQVCLELGRGGPLPPQPAGKRVFVSAESGSGNLGSWTSAGGNSGVAAGDAVCRAQATAAGLPNASTFKAWLSTSTQAAVTHLTSDGPWVRHDGVLVANSKSDLTSGNLRTSVLYDQNGSPANVEVYTGTTWGGTLGTAACSNWTSTTSTGIMGHSDSVSSWWTQDVARSCNLTGHIYCFED